MATINAKTWEISRVLALPEHGIDKEAPNWTDISYVPGTHSLAMAGYRSEKRKEGDPCAVPGIGEMPSVSARIWFISPSDTGFSNSLSVSCSAPGAQSAEHIRFHPKKQQFAVNAYIATDGSRQIYILNYPDGNLLQTIYSKTIDGTLGVIRYTPDGKYLLIGIDRPPSRHGQLDIVDADTGSIVDSIRVAFHNNEIAVNAQSTAFAVATGDGIKIWKLLPR